MLVRPPGSPVSGPALARVGETFGWCSVPLPVGGSPRPPAAPSGS